MKVTSLGKQCFLGDLSPSNHKFGDEFISSGLSAEGAIFQI